MGQVRLAVSLQLGGMPGTTVEEKWAKSEGEQSEVTLPRKQAAELQSDIIKPPAVDCSHHVAVQ